ncbi:hypothetical protein C8Q76DRAFT_229627 [Earliella scabrosa]|nr:hypothetical protein C8Q76DRAFT_229627 [Earliella scabrosa]
MTRNFLYLLPTPGSVLDPAAFATCGLQFSQNHQPTYHWESSEPFRVTLKKLEFDTTTDSLMRIPEVVKVLGFLTDCGPIRIPKHFLNLAGHVHWNWPIVNYVDPVQIPWSGIPPIRLAISVIQLGVDSSRRYMVLQFGRCKRRAPESVLSPTASEDGALWANIYLAEHAQLPLSQASSPNHDCSTDHIHSWPDMRRVVRSTLSDRFNPQWRAIMELHLKFSPSDSSGDEDSVTLTELRAVNLGRQWDARDLDSDSDDKVAPEIKLVREPEDSATITASAPPSPETPHTLLPHLTPTQAASSQELGIEPTVESKKRKFWQVVMEG